MMDPSPRTSGAPLTPNVELPLDPDPTIATPSSPPNTASNAGLPSLDSDFPQPKHPGDVDQPEPPTPAPAPRAPDEDGYIPLQPKLPGLETIVPPSD